MSKYVDTKRYSDEGYQSQIFTDGWRVALLNWSMDFDVLCRMERHRTSDEVFVLLKGNGLLMIAGDGDQPQGYETIALKRNTIYNVKQGVWHHILVKKESSVLIVENANVGPENSDVLTEVDPDATRLADDRLKMLHGNG